MPLFSNTIDHVTAESDAETVFYCLYCHISTMFGFATREPPIEILILRFFAENHCYCNTNCIKIWNVTKNLIWELLLGVPGKWLGTLHRLILGVVQNTKEYKNVVIGGANLSWAKKWRILTNDTLFDIFAGEIWVFKTWHCWNEPAELWEKPLPLTMLTRVEVWAGQWDWIREQGGQWTVDSQSWGFTNHHRHIEPAELWEKPLPLTR